MGTFIDFWNAEVAQLCQDIMRRQERLWYLSAKPDPTPEELQERHDNDSLDDDEDY